MKTKYNFFFKKDIKSLAVLFFLVIQISCTPTRLPLLDNSIDLSNYEEFEICEEGGKVNLSDNIVLDIPPNAIEEDSKFYFRLFKNDEMNSTFRNLDTSFENIFIGFEILPSYSNFKKPLHLTVENLNISPGEIPFIRKITSLNQQSEPAKITTTFNYEKRLLEIEMPHFSSLAVGKHYYKDAKCQEEPCRCKWITAMQENLSSSKENSGDCQVSVSNDKVIFHDCNTEENATFIEIGKNCEPSMNVTPEHSIIEPNESIEISANLMVDVYNLKNEEVNFQLVAGQGHLSNLSGITDNNGKVSTTYTTSDKEETAIITIHSTASYYPSTILVGNEINIRGELITKEVYGTAIIDVRKRYDKYKVALEINVENAKDEWKNYPIRISALTAYPEYDYSVNYKSNLSFIIIKPIDDTTAYVHDKVNTGIQSSLEINIKPNGLFLEGHWDALFTIKGYCTKAQVNDNHSPSSYKFKTVLNNYNHTDNTFIFAVVDPSFPFDQDVSVEEIQKSVPKDFSTSFKLDSFASAKLNHLIEVNSYLFGFIPISTDEYESNNDIEICSFGPKGGGPFIIRLEDGFINEGDAHVGLLSSLNPLPHYKITVSKIHE